MACGETRQCGMSRFAVLVMTVVSLSTASLAAGAGALLTGLVPPASAARGYHVAPHGSPRGDGSSRRPWDLATALAGASSRIRAGDTIWLRGGTYRGSFRSTIAGTDAAPVVVRQYPGERAILDGAGSRRATLTVRGSHSVFWGFEITNADTARAANRRGTGLRPHPLANYASHTKYINLVVHDGGVGFYTDPSYIDVEIAGCVFYNNGWQGPKRGAGHALYLKSYTGPVVVRDNVIFNQYGYGIHAYTDSGKGKLINIRIEGNVLFNNGVLSRDQSSANILIGGDDYATDDVVRDNFTYQSPDYGAPNVQLGYRSLVNGDVTLANNYLVGGTPVLNVGFWTSMTVRGNTFIGRGPGPLIRWRESGSEWAARGERGWGENVFRLVDGSPGEAGGASTRKWLAALDGGAVEGRQETLATGPLSTTKVVVRPNPYEAGRATIVVYNWGQLATVAVALDGVLAPGTRYEVRNVQDLFGAAITTGRFGGGSTVTIPMRPVPPPIPVGLSQSRAPRTGPEFDVFLVTVVPQ
jgi:hypothetical protein